MTLKYLGKRFNRKGQTMTEIMLMLPLIFVFMVFMQRVFFLLVLVQKIEIASYYAARRYQLQSHRNTSGGLDSSLKGDIEEYVKKYLGENDYPGLGTVKLDVELTQVWRVVTLTAEVKPLQGGAFLCRYGESVCDTGSFDRDLCASGYEAVCGRGYTIESVKYVGSRDRVLEFTLPGLSN